MYRYYIFILRNFVKIVFGGENYLFVGDFFVGLGFEFCLLLIDFFFLILLFNNCCLVIVLFFICFEFE